MKANQLLAQLHVRFGPGDRSGDEEISKLLRMLSALKDKQHQLRASLESIEDPQQRKKVENQLAVISRQRQKGIEAYQNLKKNGYSDQSFNS